MMSSPDNKIWKALNAPFAIWALSTLVVGLSGFAYSQFAATVALRHQNAEALERLSLQITVRFYHSLLMREHAVDTQLPLALDALLRDTPSTRLYAEFKERSTVSLMWEFAHRTKDSRYANESLNLLRSLHELEGLQFLLASSTTETVKHPAIVKEIRDKMRRFDDMAKTLFIAYVPIRNIR